MTTKNTHPLRVKTISDYHRIMGLPKPEHPLISVINFETVPAFQGDKPKSFVFDFYCIALKRNFNGKMKYGQQEYDFDEGLMIFLAPGQVLAVEADKSLKQKGWLLIVHPDFLWNTPLASVIKQYGYFSYAVHEALHLSEKEETLITGMIRNIEQEYRSNIDKFSQNVMVSQLDLLLIYAERFYHRQFLTRKVTNHKILNRLEAFLTDYFNSGALVEKGLPTVQSVAEALNMSPNYLSVLLNVLTGQSTQQHIHDKLIEKAKEQLSTTDLSVGEIAYALGFEHSQSFSKLFKNKTSFSPLAFRQSFN